MTTTTPETTLTAHGHPFRVRANAGQVAAFLASLTAEEAGRAASMLERATGGGVPFARTTLADLCEEKGHPRRMARWFVPTGCRV